MIPLSSTPLHGKAARSGGERDDVRSARTFARAVEQWLAVTPACWYSLRPIKATPESSEGG